MDIIDLAMLGYTGRDDAREWTQRYKATNERKKGHKELDVR
jgi:hypothetical protein